MKARRIDSLLLDCFSAGKTAAAETMMMSLSLLLIHTLLYQEKCCQSQPAVGNEKWKETRNNAPLEYCVFRPPLTKLRVLGFHKNMDSYQSQKH